MGRGFVPQPVPSPFRPTLPVVPTGYASFWRTPAWAVWRPLVAVFVAGVVYFVATLIAVAGIYWARELMGGKTLMDSLDDLTAGDVDAITFLTNNVTLAALIPLAIAVSVAFFKQPPGWLWSVSGGLRWRWLGRCFLLITPIWLVYMGIETWILFQASDAPTLGVNQDTWLLVIGILVTTPLQAAGEEFGFRAILNRAAASFFNNHRVGLWVGAVFSSVCFMFAHGAGDWWLNLYYFTFGMVTCVLVWRTGGLEASIALHVVNNLLAEATLPFTDITGVFHREAGTAGPEVLIGVAVMCGVSVLLVWQAQRKQLASLGAPGASMARAMAGAQFRSEPHHSLPVPGLGQVPNRPGPPPNTPTGAVPESHVPAPPPAARPTGDPLANPRPWETGPRDRT